MIGHSARAKFKTLLARGVRELPGWTLRVAMQYFVELYGRANCATEYAKSWLANRELQGHPLGKELRYWLSRNDISTLNFTDECNGCEY